jgi:hypothetical protein
LPGEDEESEMTSRARVGKLAAAIVVVGAAALWTPERAHAQFGFGGGGFGWGFGLFRPVPSPETYIEQKSLVNAAHPPELPSRNVYANNPNSYLNHVRDNGFVDRYSVDRREMPSYRNAPRAAPQPVAAQVPALPLSSFYNAENVLVWPADSPTAGDLKQKRDVFDKSSQVVVNESKKNGVASMASVTDARNKLLDYGRPALAYTKAHDTPRIADGFHMFLLSLYESLAQAINPAQTAAAAPSATR